MSSVQKLMNLKQSLLQFQRAETLSWHIGFWKNIGKTEKVPDFTELKYNMLSQTINVLQYFKKCRNEIQRSMAENNK